jgi:hypothetical protein
MKLPRRSEFGGAPSKVARPVREQDIGHVLSSQVQNVAGDVLASFGVLDNNPLATHFGKVR